MGKLVQGVEREQVRVSLHAVSHGRRWKQVAGDVGGDVAAGNRHHGGWGGDHDTAEAKTGESEGQRDCIPLID